MSIPSDERVRGDVLSRSAGRLLQATARRFGRAFEKRRGFLPKLLQFLAFEDDALEPELGRFFYALPPMSANRARQVIRQSLRQDPLEAFEDFDPEPFAAASIAQVHRAVLLDGQRVVVKVQYPSVAEALESDAKLLGLLSRYLPRPELTGELIEEIQVRMLEEADFRGEADRTEWFARHLRVDGVRVPTVHRALSGDRVLTLEEMPGRHLDAWSEAPLTASVRDRACARLAHQFWQSLFVLRRVHADLHPGNILLTDDGNVALIDFGSVKEIDRRLAEAAGQLIERTLADDHQGAHDAARAGGLLGSTTEDDGHRIFETAFRPFLDWLVEPLRATSHDFSAARGHARDGRNRFLRIIRENPSRGIYRPLLFLNRTVYLIYSVLERLGGRAPMRDAFEISRSEARPEEPY